VRNDARLVATTVSIDCGRITARIVNAAESLTGDQKDSGRPTGEA
jgi:hypothetical protein